MTARLRPTLLAAALVAIAPLALPQGALEAQQGVPLGLTVGTSGSTRDTLGLLVVAVVPQSPADRAGVGEGSRIASINGVRVRLTPDEVGRPGVADALVRRFDDELQSTRPGEPVVLEVVGRGQHQTLSVPLGGTGAPTVLSSTVLSSTALSGAALSGAAPAPAPVPAATAAAAPPPAAAVAPAVTPAVPVSAPTAASLPAAIAPVAAIPAVAATSAAATAAPTAADTARTATLGALIERMGELQQQLHRLARDERSLAMSDSLSDAEEDLAALRRRLRSAEARSARADAAHADSARADDALPGLHVAPVSEDLAPYFGEGSARGLLVVQADATWDPIRAGDVVLRIDGAPATAARLRDAFDPRRRSTLELLRRRRVVTVMLHGRAAG